MHGMNRDFARVRFACDDGRKEEDRLWLRVETAELPVSGLPRHTI